MNFLAVVPSRDALANAIHLAIQDQGERCLDQRCTRLADSLLAWGVVVLAEDLTASRDALARGICDFHEADSGREADDTYPCWSCSSEADALLSSGIVRVGDPR